MVQVVSAGSAGATLAGTTVGITPTGSQFGPVYEQIPFLLVTVNGTPLPNVLNVTIDLGMDVVTASASIEMIDNPNLSYNTEVMVVCGAGRNIGPRFRGFYKRTRATMWPATYTMICRGRLSLADEFQQALGADRPSFINQRLPVPGLSINDLVGTPECTDRDYVLAVLGRVPGLNPTPNDIGGTTHLFGQLAGRELGWQPYITALQACQRLDEVSLGFRLFETLDGTVVRKQIFPYPTGQPTQVFFREGHNVFEVTGDRSVEQLRNACYVEGYALGGDQGLVAFWLPSNNPLQGDATQPNNSHIDNFSSPLIETTQWAEAVAIYRVAERNREVVNATLVTFLDEFIQPGDEVYLDTPHAAINGENLWVQHITIQVTAQPILFQQTLQCIGGGLIGGAGNVVPTFPPNLF